MYVKIQNVYTIMLISTKYLAEENITFPYGVYITSGKNGCIHLSLQFRELGNLHIPQSCKAHGK